MIENKKIILGQFFTKNDIWLKNHIVEFIKSTKAKIALDPFAGEGDLLKVANNLGLNKVVGFDIDKSLNREFNDSLLNIPKINNSIIITNPPYLTNYSAKRKGIYDEVKKYLDFCKYDDIYKLAMENCFSNNFGVVIVPETFINSNFNKERLVSITIIEDLLFSDTENPICIVCFDNIKKSHDEIKIYKNDEFLGTLSFYEKLRKKPTNKYKIKFNSLQGKIALRGVDGAISSKTISFLSPEQINYDLSTIKTSSRLITLIEINNLTKSLEKEIINISNNILNKFRLDTHDILLSPFKGNNKQGKRRRRLDYFTARAILEEAYDQVLLNNLKIIG